MSIFPWTDPILGHQRQRSQTRGFAMEWTLSVLKDEVHSHGAPIGDSGRSKTQNKKAARTLEFSELSHVIRSNSKIFEVGMYFDFINQKRIYVYILMLYMINV